MTGGRVFFGGLPTDVEIRALRERWPESHMEPGDFVGYGEIASVIGADKGTSRYSVVVNRWRRIVERETGKILKAQRGEGFRVLSETEKVDLTEDTAASGDRRYRRAWKVSATVDVKEVSDDDKARLAHVQNKCAAILTSKLIRGTGTAMPDLGLISGGKK